MTFLFALSNITHPDTVTGINCTLTLEHSVRITWNPVDDITLSHYEVHRSTDNSSFSLADKVMIPRTQYIDKQLASGTYFYKVFAIDKNKYSSCAPTVTGITMGSREPFATTTIVAAGCSKTYDFVSFFSKKATSIATMHHGGGTIILSYSSDGSTYPSSERMSDRGTLEKTDRRYGLQVQSIKVVGSGTTTSFTVEAA